MEDLKAFVEALNQKGAEFVALENAQRENMTLRRRLIAEAETLLEAETAAVERGDMATAAEIAQKRSPLLENVQALASSPAIQRVIQMNKECWEGIERRKELEAKYN